MGADLGNGLLEWRIFPTSVLKVAESQRSSKMTSKLAKVTSKLTKVTSKLTKVLHRQAREPQGGDPVSRDELFHRLLKDQRNEIHVEDFLWTGSGKDFIFKNNNYF